MKCPDTLSENCVSRHSGLRPWLNVAIFVTPFLYIAFVATTARRRGARRRSKKSISCPNFRRMRSSDMLSTLCPIPERSALNRRQLVGHCSAQSFVCYQDEAVSMRELGGEIHCEDEGEESDEGGTNEAIRF
jgi:hypothetical protein